MKTFEREESIKLRKEGYSYDEISKKLNVSQATLSRWLSNLVFTDEIKDNLAKRGRIVSILNGKKRHDYWNALKEKVREDYNPPFDNPRFMLGLGLYWGEGNKTRTVGFANSDPTACTIFINWINEFFPGFTFKVYIQHYIDDVNFSIIRYWSEKLGLPIDCFGKCSRKPSGVSSLPPKRQTIPYGTARIIIKGKNAWKIKEKISKCSAIV